MMIVSNASGFVSSAIISKLNAENFKYVVAVDHFENELRNKNLEGKDIRERVPTSHILPWVEDNYEELEFLIHYVSSEEEQNNFELTKSLWEACSTKFVPFIAVVSPRVAQFSYLEKWMRAQEKAPFFWSVLLPSDMYGPNEYHRKQYASEVNLAYNQSEGLIDKTDYILSQLKDRNVLYVKDVAEVVYFMIRHRKNSDVYTLSITDESAIEKLKLIGFENDFHSLEEGIRDYVDHYLEKKSFL